MRNVKNIEREYCIAGTVIAKYNNDSLRFRELLNAAVYNTVLNATNSKKTKKRSCSLNIFESSTYIDVKDAKNLCIDDMIDGHGYLQLTFEQKEIVKRCVRDDFANMTIAIGYLFKKYSIGDYTKFFNKYKRKFVKPYVINLYDKIKNNNINYGNGTIITDLVDAILTEITNSEEYDKLFNNKMCKLKELLFTKYKFNFIITPVFYNDRRDKIFDDDEFVKFEKETVTEKNLSISEYFCTRGLQPYWFFRSIYDKLLEKILYTITINNLNDLIKDYIFSLKEMKYIESDCKAYFSRLATGTTEILNNYTEALNKLPVINLSSSPLNYRKFMAKKLSKVFGDVLNMFTKPLNYNIKKENLENLRQFYTKRFNNQTAFVEYFEEFTAVYSLLNNYHHDIRCWYDGAIDEKIEIDNRYQEFLKIFSENASKLVDVAINQAVSKFNKVTIQPDSTHKVDINQSITIYRFIAAYFRVLRTIFSVSNIVVTNNKINNINSNNFSEEIFKDGLIHDFLSTKSVIRLFKHVDLDDKINDFAKDFVDNAWKYIYNLMVIRYKYDETTFMDSGSMLYNEFKDFESDIREVIKRYKETTAYRIYDYALNMIPTDSLNISNFIKEGTSRFIEAKTF